MEQSVQEYEEKREYQQMLRDFFDQLFFEFQIQSRRNPKDIVNAYKAEKINRILEPLLEMMKEEAYARFLEKIPAPEEVKEEDGSVTQDKKT